VAVAKAESMTTLILVRHGHVEGIQPERFRGRAELPLTPLGLRQAEAARDRIAAAWQPSAIHSSPLGRCVRTAEIIAQPFGLPVERNAAFTDIDCGSWQGLTLSEAESRWPGDFALWRTVPHQMTIPGGESLHAVAARAIPSLHAVLAAHAGQTIVLVAHNSVNRVLLLHMLDLPLSHYFTLAQEPCAINVVEFADGRFRVQSFNDGLHCALSEHVSSPRGGQPVA
jgi:probable phosphoglycerate mutase